MAGLRPVADDQQLSVLRILADWRRLLGPNKGATYGLMPYSLAKGRT